MSVRPSVCNMYVWNLEQHRYTQFLYTVATRMSLMVFNPYRSRFRFSNFQQRLMTVYPALFISERKDSGNVSCCTVYNKRDLLMFPDHLTCTIERSVWHIAWFQTLGKYRLIQICRSFTSDNPTLSKSTVLRKLRKWYVLSLTRDEYIFLATLGVE